MWLNIHINIHSGDDKININNQPIQINWVGFKATCQRMVLWSSGKPCSEGLPPWACRMAGPCCSCNGRPGTLPFKFPVAEAKTQLQVLMFSLATWIKNLEECLKHLCVWLWNRARGERRSASIHCRGIVSLPPKVSPRWAGSENHVRWQLRSYVFTLCPTLLLMSSS